MIQQAFFGFVVIFGSIVFAATPAQPDDLAERVRLTVETLERQDDIRIPAKAPAWLVMHSLLAFGQDYGLRTEQQGGICVPLSQVLSGKGEAGHAKGYEPFFRAEKGIILAERGSRTVWGERHAFQFLWCMAEAGCPSSMFVEVEGRSPATISEICTDAEKGLAEFSALAWALPTIAQFKGCEYSWFNRFNEKMEIHRLLEVLLSPDHHSDDYCASAHKAFAAAKIVSLYRQYGSREPEEIQTARKWLDALWARYEKNVNSDGRIDYQAVGWPSWPDASTAAAAKAGAAGHTLAWMAVDYQRTGHGPIVDSVALDAIEALDATVIPGGHVGIMARGSLCHAVHGLRLYLKAKKP